MQESAGQVKSRVLTDDQWLEIFEDALTKVKYDLALETLDCADEDLIHLRAESRVLRKIASAVRIEVYQDE